MFYYDDAALLVLLDGGLQTPERNWYPAVSHLRLMLDALMFGGILCLYAGLSMAMYLRNVTVPADFTSLNAEKLPISAQLEMPHLPLERSYIVK